MFSQYAHVIELEQIKLLQNLPKELKFLRAFNWISMPKNDQGNVLLKDRTRFSVQIGDEPVDLEGKPKAIKKFNERALQQLLKNHHFTDDEITWLTESMSLPSKSIVTDDEKTQQLLKERGFTDLEAKQIIKLMNLKERAPSHHQDLTGMLYHIVQEYLFVEGTFPQYCVIKKEAHARLFKRGEEVYYSTEMSGFGMQNRLPSGEIEEEIHYFPGKVAAEYVLTPNGFLLTKVGASNPLLYRLIIGEQRTPPALIDLKEIEFKTAMEALQTTIDDAGVASQLKPSMRTIVEEVQRLKKALEEEILASKQSKFKETEQSEQFAKREQLLADICRKTAYLAQHPTDTQAKAHYKQCIKTVQGHRSWGKIIGGAMLAFFGAVLMVASTMALVASLGTSTPLSAIGISIGETALATGLSATAAAISTIPTVGGLVLARSGRRKNLSEAMYQFFQARYPETETPDSSKVSAIHPESEPIHQIAGRR